MINEHIWMTEARVHAKLREGRSGEREALRQAVRHIRDRRRVDRAVATALAHGLAPAEIVADVDLKLRSVQAT